MDEIQAIKESFFADHPEWRSLDLRCYPDGNWLTFYDAKTKRNINSPRLKPMDKKSMRKYHTKKQKEPEKGRYLNIYDYNVEINYTALPPRPLFPNRLIPRCPKELPVMNLPDMPENTYKQFRGHRPLTTRHRFSTHIFNRLRLDEIHENMPKFNPHPPATARALPKMPSLFERSIQPDPYEYKWNEDTLKMAREISTATSPRRIMKF